MGGAAEGGGRAQPSHRGGDFATGAKRREDGGAARPREVSGGGAATLPVFGSGAPRFFYSFFLFIRGIPLLNQRVTAAYPDIFRVIPDIFRVCLTFFGCNPQS